MHVATYLTRLYCTLQVLCKRLAIATCYDLVFNEKEEKASSTRSELMTLFILHAALVIQHERINMLLVSRHDIGCPIGSASTSTSGAGLTHRVLDRLDALETKEREDLRWQYTYSEGARRGHSPRRGGLANGWVQAARHPSVWTLSAVPWSS